MDASRLRWVGQGDDDGACMFVRGGVAMRLLLALCEHAHPPLQPWHVLTYTYVTLPSPPTHTHASNIRFDFNLSRPMTPAEVLEVERLVNSWVAAASPTSTAEMELDAARAAGATAMFGEKYDDVVRVVEVPGVSMELCGGEREGGREGERCWG